MATRLRIVPLLLLLCASAAYAQRAPTGSHYAGRASDTGTSLVSGTGGYAASVPLDLAPARGGMAIPVTLSYGRRGVGAAGLGWDIPLSFVRRDRSVARRRPEFHPGDPIDAREQIVVSIGGRMLNMVRDGVVGANPRWVARQDAPDLELLGYGDGWKLRDGNGQEFNFTEAASPDFWLLKSITNAKYNNRIDLLYEVLWRPSSGGGGKTIDLVAVQYNTHPRDPSCTKDEIRLSYGPWSPEPLSISVMPQLPLVRMRTLAAIDVTQRESCGATAERVRRYEFDYTADPDTTLPQLQTVRMAGRAHPPDTDLYVPVATYGYGAATVGGTLRTLRYQRGANVPFPVDVPGNVGIAKTYRTNASIPNGGEHQVSWRNLLDVTGDGRPDLVFEKNPNELWVATNRPGGNNATTLTAMVPLSSSVYSNRPLASQSSKLQRYDVWENPDNRWQNHDHVWRQTIDVNGDGRLDIIDAAEQPDHWTIYLNTPGNPVTWVKRSWSIVPLRQLLQSQGRHVIEGNFLPLSRRTTGFDLRMSECWKYEQGAYRSYPEGLQPGECLEENEVALNQGTINSEKTFTEWEIQDVNGDGYPDVIFNSSPVRLVDWQPPLDAGPYPEYWHVKPTDTFQPEDGDGNSIMAVLNVVGVQFDTGHNPFSSAFTLQSNTACGVGRWIVASQQPIEGCPFCVAPPDVQIQNCAIYDMNGDGLADRIDNGFAKLGTGDSFHSLQIRLPGAVRQHNPHDAECDVNPGSNYHPLQVATLRDLTGDGIPDFVQRNLQGKWEVAIGTGTGFVDPPTKIEMPLGTQFAISGTNENCSVVGSSETTEGLYDLDGDGKPEVVEIKHLPTETLEVYHLEGDRGNAQVGRLSTIDNGYGAITTITYRSAKEDASRPHQVPFPEIVVSKVQTTGSHGLGGTLSAVHYAYGDAAMFFDPTLDAFTMRSYGRVVEVYGLGDEDFESDFAIVRLTYGPPDPDPDLGSNDAERFHRYQQVGRLRDVYRLGHGVPPDAWELLRTFDPWMDTRRIAGEHYEWSSHYTPLQDPQLSHACLDTAYPYDWAKSFGWNIGHEPCAARGFTYAKVSESWTGAWAPPSGNNVQRRTEITEVDDLGRVLAVKNENDRFQPDDDVCVHLTYAEPTTDARVFTALARRRTSTCVPAEGGLFLLTDESWEFDALPYRSVSLGRPTSHTIERLATDDSEHLGSVREYEVGYTDVGNPDFVVSAREDGNVRSVTISYDEFGLVPLSTRIEGTGVDALATSIERDPVTLDVMARHDPNGTVWGREVDGFGREIRSTVTPADGKFGVVSATSYDGFLLTQGTTDPDGRRITVTTFQDPVLPDDVTNTPGQESTAYLDELGRTRRVEQKLGADYSESLVAASRQYDGLGRVSFEADPYPASQGSAGAYGTTYHFSPDGGLRCSIRGFGPQSLTEITDPAQERFPTCVERWFESHIAHVAVKTPDSLLAGSPQAGVERIDRMTATGRVLSRETRAIPNILERATHEYDRLGQLTRLRRFLDPEVGNESVAWSWRYDSRGQTLSATEPEMAARSFSYSDWGELLAVEWNDMSAWPASMRLERAYDALGRITSSVEKQNGIDVPDTAHRWIYDSGQTALLDSTFVAGRLTQTASNVGEMHVSYDALGRISARAFVDPSGEHYLEKTEQHFDGSVSKLELQLSDTSYASEHYHYQYDSASRLRSVTFSDDHQSKTLFEAREIDPLGWVRSSVYGDSIAYKATRAEIGRRLPTEEVITGAPGREQRFKHVAYDPIGREIEKRENHDARFTTTTNNYDPLGRLATSVRTGSDSQFETSFSYDPLGNVVDLVNAYDSTRTSLTYDTFDRDRICRVDYGAPVSGPCNVEHDDSGNVISQPTRGGTARKITYFPSGAVRQIEQGTTLATFRYDGSGEISELDIEGAALTDARRDRRYGLIKRREIGPSGSGQSILVREIPGAGATIASRRGAGGPWIFPFGEDSGTRFTAYDNGDTVQEVSYLPFGEATSTGTQSGTLEHTNEQWNGGDALADLGLTHLGARLYDPVIGRFLSRDPLLIPRTASTTNPYAFAFNDPVNFTDPTGLCPPEGGCSPDAMTPLVPFSGGGSNGTSGATTGQPAPTLLDKDGVPIHVTNPFVSFQSPGPIGPIHPDNYLLGSSGVRLRADVPRSFYQNHVALDMAKEGHLKLAEIAEAGHGCTFCHVVKGYSSYASANAAIDLKHYNQVAVALRLTRQAVEMTGIGVSSSAVTEPGAVARPVVSPSPGSVGAMRRLLYEANPKHGSSARGAASAAPTNGQSALDYSIPFSDNSTRRVGIDYATREFVVFAEHGRGRFHGYVVDWSELTPKMKSVMRGFEMADKRGKILLGR